MLWNFGPVVYSRLQHMVSVKNQISDIPNSPPCSDDVEFNGAIFVDIYCEILWFGLVEIWRVKLQIAYHHIGPRYTTDLCYLKTYRKWYMNKSIIILLEKIIKVHG